MKIVGNEMPKCAFVSPFEKTAETLEWDSELLENAQRWTFLPALWD